MRRSGGYPEEYCAARAEAGGKASEEKTIRPVAQCAILLLAICVSTVAAATRVHLTCITNKVVIIDTPTGSSSSDTKENLTFWIDEASIVSRLQMEHLWRVYNNNFVCYAG